MIKDHFGMYLVLIPHCITEILAKECKSGKSTVLALGTVSVSDIGLHKVSCCLSYSVQFLQFTPAVF